ncbi:unnamed protein product [Cercopithifilaria johnstoni]|uniref:DENN domain-containing protein 5A n=1 Tax=Cercopithifilaria johnstoni TaxID=2874296 RepID=A0A8J2LXY9_9BILA|nr:unnamed protein product [Cercopithifilaria johnstoni]
MTSNVPSETTTTTTALAQAPSASDLTLVDYFVLVGHDNSALLQAIEPGGRNDLDATELLYIPPLERSYVPSILHHFPERRSAYSFPSEIVSLCMPKGLKFYTQNNVPSPAMHTFANIREDGSRINGCALIYHEEVKDAELCEHMSQLHTEHVRVLTAREKATERAHVPPGTVSGGTHTLPRGSRKNRAKRTSYYDSGNSQLYVAKCICLISRIPFVSAGEHLLTAIHSLFTSEAQPPPLPLESYIYWILNEVPLPAPSSTLKICLDRIDIVLQRPGPNELPFFDHAISSLFDLLTVDKFLRLFTCFLLEHQILLCSRSFQRLMLVAESLCSLAFPFRWQLTYVPILPYSQLKFMEAPVPFVMGLCYENAISEQIFQGNMCVLDIDSGVLNLPEDVPALPDRAEFAKEVANVLMRYEEQSAVLDNEEVRRQTSTTAKDDWYKKRMSRSFDGETLPNMLDEDNSSRRMVSRKDLAPLHFDDVLKQSEVLARVTAIAHRAGVSVPFENIQKELQSNDFYTNSPVCREYFKNMKINNAVREVFINRFAWLLYSYEHFVINTACQDLETYFASRESVANFDKAAFLSDQPSKNLPFLAAFLETQMFTSFIDAKIVSQWETTADENLQIFDSRIQTLRTKYGLQMVRTPTYEKAPPCFDSEETITKREEALDYIVPLPHELPGTSAKAYDGTFPELNKAVLEGSFVRSPVPSPWKQRHRRLRPKLLESIIVDSNTANKQNSYKTDTPRQIAHQNWKFVEQLLKETKSKTKRMLVEKMGREALQLGHSDAIVNGLEENTLVASFCDLLERIWAHGSLNKQGKSSLWAHILHHQEVEKLGILSHDSARRNSSLTPAFEWLLFRRRFERIVEIVHESQSEQESMDEGSINELARSIRQQCIDDPYAPGWSLPILRAANFICDKLSSSVNNNVEYSDWKSLARSPCLSSNPVVFGRSRSPQKMSRRGAFLHRANSFGDFAPYWTTAGTNVDENATDSARKRSNSRTASPDVRQFLAPLPVQIAYDLKNILRMTDIKTDIGYARAFVRLSLERKLLHKHLKTILSNTHLLQQLYKRYAFLRCDEEKEQFLYHVLSLNAAEFSCFTNSFKKTKMQYRVLLVSRNSRSVISWPVWIIITGSLCSTTPIELKQSILDFTFDYRNLGILSTLRIGHLNVSNGASPKWFLDYVLVRNEITGQSYRFNCGRWFGKGIDDDSLERLLVAEKEAQIAPKEMLIEECSSERVIKAYPKSRTPPRSRSPSTSRSETSSRIHLTEIQQQLGEAVNALVKYFYSNAEGRSHSELTQLLCAPGKGFVSVMVVVFMYGRQDSIWSARLFRSHYPWDYIEKVCVWFWDLIHMEDAKRLTREQRSLIIQACRLVRRISFNTFLGKDGKFQLFILITVRDHILSGLLPLMAWTPITSQMYEEPSFLRTPHHLNYLSKLISSLNEFQFVLEKSLIYGIE